MINRLTLQEQIRFLTVANSCFHRKVCKATSCENCEEFKKFFVVLRKITKADAIFWLEKDDRDINAKLFLGKELLLPICSNIFNEETNKFARKQMEKLSALNAGKSVYFSTVLHDRKGEKVHCHICIFSLILQDNFMVFVWKDRIGCERSLMSKCGEIVNDILRWKKLNLEFLKNNKSAMAGLMAGTMVHDLNSIISGVLSSLQLMNYTGIKKEDLKEISCGLKRGTEMINSLLSFIRSEEKVDSYSVLDLNKVVKEASPLMGLIVGKRCKLVIKFFDEPLPIRGVKLRIKQLLLNLVSNAKDAVARKLDGRVQIGVERIASGKDFLSILSKKPYVLLSVSDNGCGITNENAKKIFEPFFTTKQDGKGTGLGLFIVKTIMEEHSGIISFKSRVGEGTTFYCYFPLANK